MIICYYCRGEGETLLYIQPPEDVSFDTDRIMLYGMAEEIVCPICKGRGVIEEED